MKEPERFFAFAPPHEETTADAIEPTMRITDVAVAQVPDSFGTAVRVLIGFEDRCCVVTILLKGPESPNALGSAVHEALGLGHDFFLHPDPAKRFYTPMAPP